MLLTLDWKLLTTSFLKIMEALEEDRIPPGVDVSLLCLRCRSAGHLMQDCSLDVQVSEFGWFFSPARRALIVDLNPDSSQEEICKRCRDLDIVSLLHQEMPWNSLAEVDQAVRDGSDSIRSIGQAGSIEFRTTCPVCRCLFAMTPNPNSLTQEVLVLPHWTMGRLVGENENGMSVDDKHRYAKCLLVALKPGSINVPFSLTMHRGDALCIDERDRTDKTGAMAGRVITQDSLNITLIKEWLDTCWQLHGQDCKPQYSANLQNVRLVDIETRKVVAHPAHPCEYVTLSYVWGNEKQKSFQLGSRLGDAPQTIENAMECTLRLGKRYLWVDAICIDQFDDNDKKTQIGMMWSIYRGAWINIIALSGDSASSGLARIGSRPSYPQIGCKIDGKRLVSLMPTLTQQIWVSPWGQRAWTLQEALLAPRSLYLSDHQLYFECNAMQCCESLDQDSSWAHNLDCNTGDGNEENLTYVKAQNGPGCLKNPLDTPLERLRHWGAKVILYCYRSMTKQEDALNAFSGVLQRLESMYETGFFWGLPQADFQWGLLWQARVPSQRREAFPSWSWAGWRSPIWPGEPQDFTKPNEYPVQLHVQKVVNSRLVDVFKTNLHTEEAILVPAILQHEDALANAEKLTCIDEELDMTQYSEERLKGYIFVEAIALNFQPDYSHPCLNRKPQGEFQIFLFLMRNVVCELRVMDTDAEINGSAPRDGEPTYLLLARDRGKGVVGQSMFHYLLLVYVKDGLAVRGTVMILIIPEERLELLADLKPQKRRVVLT
jgi:hypothetical protein